MRLNPFDLLAVILAIFYTIRKLDAVGRSPSEFPHVPEAEFLAWRARERSVYHTAALACVLKIVVGLGFQYLVAPGLPVRVVQVIGGLIDLSWLGVVVRTWVAASKLRKERARLGIWLGPAPLTSGGSANEDDGQDE
jgi:hypothetical protein